MNIKRQFQSFSQSNNVPPQPFDPTSAIWGRPTFRNLAIFKGAGTTQISISAGYTIGTSGSNTLSFAGAGANGYTFDGPVITTNGTFTSGTGLSNFICTSQLGLGTTTGGTLSGLNLGSGSPTTQFRIGSYSNGATLGQNNSYGALILGTTAITEFSSGTHVLICQMGIRQLTITNGAAATTDATGLYIENAPTGITPTNPATAIWSDNGINRFDGVLQLGVTISSAASLTLDTTANVWVFSGTTTTWTLPAVTAGTGIKYHLKNRGSGAITLNSSAGGNDIYNTSAGSSLTINAGEHYILILDGTYWLVC